MARSGVGHLMRLAAGSFASLGPGSGAPDQPLFTALFALEIIQSRSIILIGRPDHSWACLRQARRLRWPLLVCGPYSNAGAGQTNQSASDLSSAGGAK